MRRPGRLLWLLVAVHLLPACVARESARPVPSRSPEPSALTIPLSTPDPRYAAYFAELKRCI